MAFFGEFSSTFERRTDEQTIENQGNTLNNAQSYRQFNNSLFAGLALFPSNWVSIEASINPLNFGLSRRIDASQSDFGDRINSSSFNLGVNTAAIYLGFNFFLNRK